MDLLSSPSILGEQSEEEDRGTDALPIKVPSPPSTSSTATTTGYDFWTNLVVLTLLAAGCLLDVGGVLSAPWWAATLAVVSATSWRPSLLRPRLLFCIFSCGLLSALYVIIGFLIGPRYLNAKTGVLWVQASIGGFLVSLLTTVLVAVGYPKTRELSLHLSPLASRKLLHALEYGAQYAALVGGALVIFTNLDRKAWVRAGLLSGVLILGSLTLMTLKAWRAATVYAYARWVHLLLLLGTLALWQFLGAVFKTFDLAIKFVLIVPCLLYGLSGTLVKDYRTDVTVYLEQMLQEATLSRLRQSRLLRIVADYEFLLRGSLLITWALSSPSLASSILAAIALVSLLYLSRHNVLWSFTTAMGSLTLIADQLLDFHCAICTPGWLIFRCLFRLAILATVHMLREVGECLKSNALGADIPEDASLDEKAPEDPGVDGSKLRRRIGYAIWWSLMLGTFLTAVVDVTIVNGMLLFLMTWFLTSPKAAHRLFPFYTGILALFIVGQVLMAASSYYPIRVNAHILKFLVSWGLHPKVGDSCVWAHILLLSVSLVYQHFFRDYQRPMFERRRHDRSKWYWRWTYNTSLPLLIGGMLVIALVQSTFGILSLGYFLLFLWYSLRGMMIHQDRERRIFLKVLSAFSIGCLLAIYACQFGFVINGLATARLASLQQVLADLGLFKFPTTGRLLRCLLGALIVALLSRLQYVLSYEYGSPEDDAFEVVEEKPRSVLGEVVRRFLYLHGHKLLSLSLLLAAACEFSLFSIIHFLVGVAILFAYAPPHLSRPLSISLTVWLFLDIMSKFVVHFQWIRRNPAYIISLLLGLRIHARKAVDPKDQVFELVLWQVAALIVNAFQPIIATWSFPGLDQTDLHQDKESQVGDAAIKDEGTNDEIKDDGSKNDKVDESKGEERAKKARYLQLWLIPVVGNDRIEGWRQTYFEAWAYYVSHWFSEFGSFFAGGLSLYLSVVNRNVIGLVYVLLTLLLTNPQVSTGVLSGSILTQVIVMIYYYCNGYLHNLAIRIEPKNASLAAFLALRPAYSRAMFIYLFFCLAMTIRLMIHNTYVRQSRFLSAPSDLADPLIQNKRKLIIYNAWFAFTLIFMASVTQTTLAHLPLIGFALAFTRRGEMMFLQRISRQGQVRKRWDIVRTTWLYVIFLVLGIGLLAYPTDNFLAKIVTHRRYWELAFRLLGVYPIMREAKWQDVVMAMGFGLLLLHDLILRSPLADALSQQIRQERQFATRRANRFHLHRIESLRQQLDFDTAAAEETRRRIKERTGLSAKIDLSSWHEVFPGDPDYFIDRFKKADDDDDNVSATSQPGGTNGNGDNAGDNINDGNTENVLHVPLNEDALPSATIAQDPSRDNDKENEKADPYRISPHPHALNVTRRKIEHYIETQEEQQHGGDFDDIRDVEAGPKDDLFSPLSPVEHRDMDERDYPYRTVGGEIGYFWQWIYFKLLRTVMSWSEEFRHICEVKQTYQLVEQAKYNKSPWFRTYLLLLGLWYAFVGHFPFVVFAIAFVNAVYYANMPSVIPTFLILLSGACQRPFTKPSFWKLLLRYTILWILFLFTLHLPWLQIITSMPKIIMHFDWKLFLGLSGYNSKLEAFAGPCALLFALIMQRSMMRYLGTWNTWREHHPLHNTSTTGAHASEKRNVGVVDWLTGLADDFGGFLKSFGELPGKDFYTPMFLCDLLCFLISCAQWNMFSGQQLGESSNKLRFLNMVIRDNSVPAGFVVLAILQVALMLLDRVIYCRKALKMKVLLQFISLTIHHMWVVFVVPLRAQIPFRESSSLVAWYVFKWLYWYNSALQVRQGYPLFRTSNFLFEHYTLLNYYTFIVFRSIPLFNELRIIIDWTFTPSTLSVYQWFKFEQIRALLFGIRSNRQFCWSRAGRRALGQPKTQIWKYILGGLMIFGLCALVFFPLIWLSAPGSMLPNPVHHMHVSVDYGTNGRLLEAAVFTEPPPQGQLSTSEYNSLVERRHMPSFFSQENIQKFQCPKLVSQNPFLSAQFDELIADLSGNPSRQVCLWTEWTLTRAIKKSIDMRTRGNKKDLADRQPERTVVGGFDVAVRAGDLADLLTGQRPSLDVVNLLPQVLEVPSVGQPVAVNFTSVPKTFTLRRVPGPALAGLNAVWLTVDSAWTLYLHNHRVSGHRLSNYGVLGLYATFVYAVARTLRNSLSNLPLRIPFEDLPNPDILTAICDDLLRVREFLDFRSEESLFWQLTEIFRRPHDLHDLTQL